jgi:hypothetical protein
VAPAAPSLLLISVILLSHRSVSVSANPPLVAVGRSRLPLLLMRLRPVCANNNDGGGGRNAQAGGAWAQHATAPTSVRLPNLILVHSPCAHGMRLTYLRMYLLSFQPNEVINSRQQQTSTPPPSERASSCPRVCSWARLPA